MRQFVWLETDSGDMLLSRSIKKRRSLLHEASCPTWKMTVVICFFHSTSRNERACLPLCPGCCTHTSAGGLCHGAPRESVLTIVSRLLHTYFSRQSLSRCIKRECAHHSVQAVAHICQQAIPRVVCQLAKGVNHIGELLIIQGVPAHGAEHQQLCSSRLQEFGRVEVQHSKGVQHVDEALAGHLVQPIRL